MIKFSDNFNNSLLDMFLPLSQELLLYEFGHKIKKHLTNEGFDVTQLAFHKEISPYIKEVYNVDLAYRLVSEGKVDSMVSNDLNLDSDGNIFILTGANRGGGKTTFTQAIGQVYWFGMLGLYVGGAKSMNIKIPDGIYIHFPSEEEETVLFGRLGEECQRFAKIFDRMTDSSLILMNESFSGTSHLESLTIAGESLSAVRMLGASCLFNTHLHELALKVDEFNSTHLKPRFTNLVSGSEEVHQSFKILEGEPLGKSYAYEIAKKYGVTYEQLVN